jgi:hypothetical protein
MNTLQGKIDLSHYPAGLYVLNVALKNGDTGPVRIIME